MWAVLAHLEHVWCVLGGTPYQFWMLRLLLRIPAARVGVVVFLAGFLAIYTFAGEAETT